MRTTSGKPRAASIRSIPIRACPAPGKTPRPWLGGAFRFGVPAADQLEFFGDDEAAGLYQRAIADLEAMGGEKVEIDFSIFRAAADLLYSGPWVAERLAAIRSVLRSTRRRHESGGARHHQRRAAVHRGGCIRGRIPAARLRRASEPNGRAWTCWLLPTTGTIYTHEAVAADPVRLNTNLGYYTNFVNLLDLAAVAVPAGFRSNGLPFGISLIGPAFTDEALLASGRPLSSLATTCPASGRVGAQSAGLRRVAVVGAHLTGQPLNWQLTQRGARLHEDLPHRRRLPALRAGRHARRPSPAWSAKMHFRAPASKWKSGPCPRIGSAVSSPPCRRRSESATPRWKTAKP